MGLSLMRIDIDLVVAYRYLLRRLERYFSYSRHTPNAPAIVKLIVKEICTFVISRDYIDPFQTSVARNEHGVPGSDLSTKELGFQRPRQLYNDDNIRWHLRRLMLRKCISWLYVIVVEVSYLRSRLFLVLRSGKVARMQRGRA